MPNAVTTLGMLAIEVNELFGVGRQALEDMHLVAVCIHHAQAILVLEVHVTEKLVRELR
jgi:hypothetical protein